MILKLKWLWFVLSLGLVVLGAALVFVGTPVLNIQDVFNKPHSLDHYVFWNLRFPQTVLAFVVGASLALSGVSFQSMLKNPLADPYILGVSGGAALGYVVATVMSLPAAATPFLALTTSLLFLLLLYQLSMVGGVLSTLQILLVGIVFNAFSFAAILIINSLTSFGQADQILYLLVGHVDPLPWFKVILLGLFFVVSFFYLWGKSQVLNILSLGESEAKHLGVAVEREKAQLFIITSVLVAASVSWCGLIGFVGLVVPHAVRFLVGCDHKMVIPVSALMGGALLMVCDFLADHVVSFETLATKLPVGAVTAIIGAPLFVVLLKRQRV